MKKLTLVIVLSAISLMLLPGCNSDGKKTNPIASLLGVAGVALGSGGVECIGDFCGQTSEDPIEPYFGPTAVMATDGTYTDKVGINWATISNAESYRIYRSSNVAGPFTDQIATIYASDLSNSDSSVVTTDPGVIPDVVTTPSTGGTCENPVMQATYQSKRDIGYGIYLPWGIHPTVEHYTIDLYIGGNFRGTIDFVGAFPLGTNWTQDKIVAEFNKYLGNDGTCYPVTVDGKRYIKIVSSKSIRMINFYEIVRYLWVPLDFLDFNSDWSTEINVQPIQIACSDTTAPTVSQVSPANGATDIALNAKVSVAFSEAINPATMTSSSFKLTVDGVSVEGTISNTGVFTPSSELIAGKEYTATITTGVTDLADNPLAANYSWKFRTSESSTVLYYYLDSDVAQGTHYYYIVTAVDEEGNESTESPVEEGFTKSNDSVPSKVPSCSASDGITGGVTVTWAAATNATYYKVYRISSSGQAQVGGNIAGTTYTDTAVAPGIFSYKVAPFNANGEGGSSDPDAGYRAITNEEFFSEAYNELESAFEKLGELGTSDKKVYDKDGNGNCLYDVTILSAKAVMTFTNYSDIYLTLDGDQTTVLSDYNNIDGTIKGQLNVAGLYNGYIVFDLIITGGEASGGTYKIKQNGSTEITLPGTYMP